MTQGGNAMSRGRIVTVVVSIVALAYGLGIETSIGQQSPPTENKGVSVGKTTVVDLGPEIQGMQGRQLRTRVITVDPGGHIRQHSHNDWPGVVYVLQGVVTEYQGSRRTSIASATRSQRTRTQATGLRTRGRRRS